MFYSKKSVQVKAFARAEEIIGRRNNEIQPPVKLYVIHANNLEVAIAEKEKLQKKYPNAEIEIGHFDQSLVHI